MRKLLISILSVALGAALIYGATMAWFTDEAEVEPTTFTAGTVILGYYDDNEVLQDADELIPVEIESEYNEENVNPGDSFAIDFNIANNGTKRILVRFIPEYSYVGEDGDDLSTDNIIIDQNSLDALETDGWYKGADGYFYNNNELEPDQALYVNIRFTFDGAMTTNEYQGSTLTVGGTVQAIQASHSSDVEDGGWNWANFDSYN